uniref:hypothetical protein n=1 Tax=Rhodococcus erythropolis TaxID=1833 RepID=UPI000BB348CF|nr:hypothetical protein [Rhodococcus erythropolis]
MRCPATKYVHTETCIVSVEWQRRYQSWSGHSAASAAAMRSSMLSSPTSARLRFVRTGCESHHSSRTDALRGMWVHPPVRINDVLQLMLGSIGVAVARIADR